jgi:hypothetical protein
MPKPNLKEYIQKARNPEMRFFASEGVGRGIESVRGFAGLVHRDHKA